jgi:hypothetical protein
MEVLKTIEFKGYSIKISRDADPINPREDENLGTMICFHKRRNLGDKDQKFTQDELMSLIESDTVIALPLYLYDHSGITINTTGFSDKWDSGKVGYIFVGKEQVKREYG